MDVATAGIRGDQVDIRVERGQAAALKLVGAPDLVLCTNESEMSTVGVVASEAKETG